MFTAADGGPPFDLSLVCRHHWVAHRVLGYPVNGRARAVELSGVFPEGASENIWCARLAGRPPLKSECRSVYIGIARDQSALVEKGMATEEEVGRVAAARRQARHIYADGLSWLVYELPPSQFDRRSVPSLIFESEQVVRVVRVFHPNWRELSDEALFALSLTR